jgi:maleate isomerase
MTIRLGMLTPSSNTVLEPITTAMLAGVSGVTAHFSRFRVTEIALSRHALGSLTMAKSCVPRTSLRTPRLTSSPGMARRRVFDYDERLCERIIETTDITACTSVLAFPEIVGFQTGERTELARTPDRRQVAWPRDPSRPHRISPASRSS